jgi:tripartite-type tricarboxylate transporter receptor subunit TctC
MGTSLRKSAVPRRQLELARHKALADAAIRERLFAIALEPVGGSTEQFARVVREDSAKYAQLTKDLRIKID